MTDHLDKAKRSWNMNRIRGRNATKTGGCPAFRELFPELTEEATT